MLLGLAPGVALAQTPPPAQTYAYVQPTADVSVSIQANTTPVARAGQPLDYMLVVGNAGPSAASGVRLSFSSANLTNLQVSGACSALPCMITTLGAGYNASIYVHATVAADGPFTLSAGAMPRQKDPQTPNNTASVTVNPPSTASKPGGGSADVSVSIRPGGKLLARAGQGMDSQLVVTNLGPSAATGIRVSSSSVNLTNAQVSGACSALPCMIATLGAGYNASIDVHATVAADGPFTLKAAAMPRQNDPQTSNNTASVTVNPPATAPKPGGETADVSADVSISIEPSGKPRARAGEGLDYQLLVANAGPSAARRVSVKLASANLDDPQVSGSCARLPCSISALAAGATASITVHQTVVADRPFSLKVLASASQPDPNTANNADGVSVTPPPHKGPGEWLPWLFGTVAGLLALGLGTMVAMNARARSRWLRQLSVSGDRGSEDAFAPGPLSFVAPSLGVTVRCEAGESGPIGPVPILKVVSDD